MVCRARRHHKDSIRRYRRGKAGAKFLGKEFRRRFYVRRGYRRCRKNFPFDLRATVPMVPAVPRQEPVPNVSAVSIGSNCFWSNACAAAPVGCLGSLVIIRTTDGQSDNAQRIKNQENTDGVPTYITGYTLSSIPSFVPFATGSTMIPPGARNLKSLPLPVPTSQPHLSASVAHLATSSTSIPK